MNKLPLEYINTWKKSGMVVPSSKYLIKKCLRAINFDTAKVIVEFGMGDGCITHEILKKCGADTQLISFELNEKFCEYCSDKFKGHPSLQIVNESAFEFQNWLQQNNIEKVDYLVSSLPITFFDKADMTNLLQDIRKILTPNGRFIQYQYSLQHKGILKSVFPEVSVDFTILNMPPAFIYKCA